MSGTANITNAPADVTVTFVLFPLGSKRFALPAETVTELAQPDRLHTFPHTNALLAGVLLRRGRIVPVCDVARVLAGPNAPERRFYLIALRGADQAEWLALPVNGECELLSAGMIAPTAGLPDHVRGLLSLADEIIEVIDLDKLLEVNA